MNETGDFAYCPIFDQGAGLLSDTTMDYPLEEDIYILMKQVQAKTLCTDFDEQLDLSEKFYKQNLKFSFTKQDVQELLDNATIYPSNIRARIQQIIYEQMRKYSYLFY